NNTHINLRNNMSVNFGGSAGFGELYDDRLARGGPAVRVDGYFNPWIFVAGDDRHAIVPYFEISWRRRDGGRSHAVSLSPELDFKLSTRMTAVFQPGWSSNTDDRQWITNHVDTLNVTHYTFAHLEQKTLSVTLRFNYTFSPNATLQVYAQPFITKGTYSNF